MIKKRELVLIALLHVALLASFYFILTFFGFIKFYPDNIGLINFDVGWYKNIVENGYTYIEGEQSNIAFYPLFPYLWKLLSVNAIFMGIINFLIYLLGLIVLQRTYNFSIASFLLFLSIPSNIFYYMPYSEALFFLSGALMLYGFKNSKQITILGIFLACLCRSVSLIFLPIFLVMLIYNNLYIKNKNYSTYLKYMLTTVVATLLVQLIQYFDTSLFFGLFKTHSAWGRSLSLPRFPFTTWDNARLLWLDGLALFVGSIALYLCFIFLIRKVKRKKSHLSLGILFTVGYLTLITVSNVIYAPIDELGGTSLISLNRYVFATPFFIALLSYFFRSNLLSFKNTIAIIVIILTAFYLFFGDINNLDSILLNRTASIIYYIAMGIYAFVFFISTKNKIRKRIVSGIYIFNLLLQHVLLNYYFNNIWVG